MSYGSMDRYREMEVMAMPPARRLVALYTQLLAALRQARHQMELGQIESRTERLLHAEEIVRELMVSLDRERGGELARRLSDLYSWMLTQVATIHSRPELARLDQVIRIVSELHEAWGAAASQVTSTSSAA
ncbi:MAG: flagellar export chaperone FliS [Gemmatimonadota bacterium]|nr:flagellar export chaperone FliS [Gemmatimonadota bacterium]